MKRIITLLLSFMMVFTACMTISADGGSITAEQASNGDLIIKANDDKGKAIIKGVYDGTGKRVNTDGKIRVNCGPYDGVISNVHSIDYQGKSYDEVNISISEDGSYLTVKKDALVSAGFIDGTWTLTLSAGEKNVKPEEAQCTVTMGNIGTVTPNKATSLTLEGKIRVPIEGESTYLDRSNLTLKDQAGNVISFDNYDIHWNEKKNVCTKMVNGSCTLYEDRYEDTHDSVFDVNKIYYLYLRYEYVYGENDSGDVNLNYKYGNLLKTDNGMGHGGSIYFATTRYKYYIMEYTVGKVEVKNTSSVDVSSEIAENVAIKNTATQVQTLVDITTAEQAAIDTGKNLEISLSIGSESNVSAEDVSKVASTVTNDGLTQGAIYDVSLYKTIEDSGTSEKVTETNEDTIISFPLDSNLINDDSSIERTYKVVRVHDGESTVLEDVTFDESTNSIKFGTDKFSTYAICYKDTKKEEKNTDSSSDSSTKVVTCQEAMNSNNWLWSNTKKACVYKVSNTSTK